MQNSELPKIDLPDDNKPERSKKALSVVVLVLGSLFFVSLALMGGMFYVLQAKANAKPGDQVDVRDSSTVKSVEWVAPADISTNFALRGESTDSSKTLVYEDLALGCKITTTVQDFVDQSNEQEFLVKQADSVAKVADSKSGTEYFIKDVDAVHDYNFDSVLIEQTLDLPEIGFDKIFNQTVFKQFNYQLASISYACKSDAWDANKATLDELINKFTVKTERIT